MAKSNFGVAVNPRGPRPRCKGVSATTHGRVEPIVGRGAIDDSLRDRGKSLFTADMAERIRGMRV